MAEVEAESAAESGFDVSDIAAELQASLGAAMAERSEPDFDPAPDRRFESSPGPSPKDFAMDDDGPSRSRLFAEKQQPIPDVFTKAREPRPPRGKGIGLFFLLLAVTLAVIGGAAVYFQDRVIALLPEAGAMYEMVGLRNETIGAGLIFRNYSSERPVQDGNEVLIVRGIIANTTDRQREVPLLRLALFDKADVKLQERVVKPPAGSLEAGGTVGFRIALEQPRPEAVRFELTFTAPDRQ